MRAVLITVGNPLRGDDGVAHMVADIVDDAGLGVIRTHQITPELAAELAGRDLAVFVDADVAAERPVLEPAPEVDEGSALSHAIGPGMAVALARKLYGFTGQAWWCRIPARDLTPGAPVSDTARQHAASAAAMVGSLLQTHA